MSMGAMDRHARKQVLLTRIAFERTELRAQLAQVNLAARPSNLLRGAVGGKLAASLLGVAAPVGKGGWLGLAWSLLRRYRVAAALLGGVAPVMRAGARGGWRRTLRIGGLAAAAWFGWRFLQGRDRPT